MSLQVAGRAIRRMTLIDDDPSNREAWSYPIEDLGIEPVLEDGPLGDINAYVAHVTQDVDAILCDHHLKIKSAYSEINGAELVSKFYMQGAPAILCTRYEDRIDEIRRYRKNIPVWLNPEELNDIDNIARGLELCINEINGQMTPSRNPWRTLVRVEDIDTSISDDNPYIEFILPSWDKNRVIRMLRSDLPEGLPDNIDPGFRCHAKVNIGAESMEELYFDEWEF